MTPEDHSWSNSVGSIILFAKHLSLKRQEKNNLTKKELESFFRLEYNCGMSRIEKIIGLAEHPIISNPENYGLLPSRWTLLYELAQLPDKVLLEKIKSGEAKNFTKYQIWALRGIKVNKSYIKFDTNKNLINYVRDGMSLEKRDNLEIDEAAKALGLNKDTYRKIRTLIVLHDRKELTDEDRAFVQSLLQKIERERHIRLFFIEAKDLIEKVWGRGRGKNIRSKAAAKRVDAFRTTCVVMQDTCTRLTGIEIPYMSDSDITESIQELNSASQLIRELVNKLRRLR